MNNKAIYYHKHTLEENGKRSKRKFKGNQFGVKFQAIEFDVSW